MTEDDPVFNRSCIPFLRSAPVPALPGTICELSVLIGILNWLLLKSTTHIITLMLQ